MKSNLQTHLEMVAKMMRDNSRNPQIQYLSIHEFVLAHGKQYAPRKRTEIVPKSTAHECFSNSVELLYESSAYTYVEGYISVCGVPLQHAWCIKDCVVVDPTIPTPNKDWEYFGVAFRTEFVLKTIMKRGRYGIIDNPEQRFPLLQGKHGNMIIK